MIGRRQREMLLGTGAGEKSRATTLRGYDDDILIQYGRMKNDDVMLPHPGHHHRADKQPKLRAITDALKSTHLPRRRVEAERQAVFTMRDAACAGLPPAAESCGGAASRTSQV